MRTRLWRSGLLALILVAVGFAGTTGATTGQAMAAGCCGCAASALADGRSEAPSAVAVPLVVNYGHDSALLFHNEPGCRPWEITKEGTARTLRSDRFGKFFQSKSGGLWWLRDLAGHGGSAWKVFEEESDGLHWITDATEEGDFIDGKHKSPTGQFIP